MEKRKYGTINLERGLGWNSPIRKFVEGGAMSASDVKIPRKTYVYSIDDDLRSRGVIVPDASKFKYKPQPSFEPDVSEEYKESLSKFISRELDSRLALWPSEENLSEIGSLLAYVKDYDLGVDLFDYTLRASKLEGRIYKWNSCEKSEKVKMTRAEMEAECNRE